MAQIMTGLEVRKVFADGSDVLAWFDLATSVAETVPVANWMHVEDGKITRIGVAFDARGIANGSRPGRSPRPARARGGACRVPSRTQPAEHLRDAGGDGADGLHGDLALDRHAGRFGSLDDFRFWRHGSSSL